MGPGINIVVIDLAPAGPAPLPPAAAAQAAALAAALRREDPAAGARALTALVTSDAVGLPRDWVAQPAFLNDLATALRAPEEPLAAAAAAMLSKLSAAPPGVRNQLAEGVAFIPALLAALQRHGASSAAVATPALRALAALAAASPQLQEPDAAGLASVDAAVAAHPSVPAVRTVGAAALCITASTPVQARARLDAIRLGPPALVQALQALTLGPGRTAVRDTHGIHEAALLAAARAYPEDAPLAALVVEALHAPMRTFGNDELPSPDSVPVIVAVLQRHVHAAAVAKSGCDLLTALAKIGEAQAHAIAESGGIAAVVSAITAHLAAEDVATAGVSALLALAGIAEERAADVHAASGLQVVLSALRAQPASMYLPRPACELLLRLAGASPPRAAAVAAGRGLATLLGAARTNYRVANGSAAALCCVATAAHGQEAASAQAVADGAVALAMDVIRWATRQGRGAPAPGEQLVAIGAVDELARAACVLLRTLALGTTPAAAERRTAIYEAGAVAALVELSAARRDVSFPVYYVALTLEAVTAHVPERRAAAVRAGALGDPPEAPPPPLPSFPLFVKDSITQRLVPLYARGATPISDLKQSLRLILLVPEERQRLQWQGVDLRSGPGAAAAAGAGLGPGAVLVLTRGPEMMVDDGEDEDEDEEDELGSVEGDND